MAYSDRFIQAVELVNKIHAEQLRKETQIPYISHLLSVAGIVAEYGGSEDQVIAALLHDALEDQGDKITAGDIEDLFGKGVSDIVLACSDSVITEDEKEKAPWKDRKLAYLDSIKKKPQEVLLVTTADKLHNSRSILRDYLIAGENLWSRFTGGKDGTLWYYRGLAEALDDAWGQNPILPEFSRVVDDIHSAASNADSAQKSSSRPWETNPDYEGLDKMAEVIRKAADQLRTEGKLPPKKEDC